MTKPEVFSSWQHPDIQCLREALLHEQQIIESKNNRTGRDGDEIVLTPVFVEEVHTVCQVCHL